MELPIQNISLNTSVILTGISAGLFYAWSVSVIPGTQKINDLSYLYTMQSINRAILNPAFFIVFFGSLIALACSTYFTYNVSTKGFWFLLITTAAYLIGTVGITGLGNVPLNNELEALKIPVLSKKEVAEFRKYYESHWNKLHTYRMLFSVLSFVMALLALNITFKN
ncbi:anthrone oxygenase family protein [Ekhidna sp.]